MTKMDECKKCDSHLSPDEMVKGLCWPCKCEMEPEVTKMDKLRGKEQNLMYLLDAPTNTISHVGGDRVRRSLTKRLKEVKRQIAIEGQIK